MTTAREALHGLREWANGNNCAGMIYAYDLAEEIKRRIAALPPEPVSEPYKLGDMEKTVDDETIRRILAGKHHASLQTVIDMAGTIQHLRQVIDLTAQAWLSIDGITWEGGIDSAMRAAVDEIKRLRQAGIVPPGCGIHPFSSGVCERGTKSCVVVHEKRPDITVEVHRNKSLGTVVIDEAEPAPRDEERERWNKMVLDARDHACDFVRSVARLLLHTEGKRDG